MSTHHHILVFDGRNAFSDTIFPNLSKRGFEFRYASFDQVALDVSKTRPDAILLNCTSTPDHSYVDLVRSIRLTDDHIPIIILTPRAQIEDAVHFIKQGVTEFYALPIAVEQLEEAIQQAIHIYKLARRIYQMTPWTSPSGGPFLGMVGQSLQMQENFRLISTVAKSKANVLILGASGTGKELVAKALHALSDRSRCKFIDINCGAIPHNLLENELFGHERGAYTGADSRYIGSFEVAHGGTVFLDEISEMDPSLQVKILRFLQEKSFQRVGGTELISVDVRIVAATNRDLEQEVKSGRFREDLFYRLNVVPIVLPTLNDRREDIPLLARHFLDIYCRKNHKIFLDFHPQALEALINYSWPGNVRELENVIERVVVLSNDSQVKLKHLPPHLQKVAKTTTWFKGQKADSLSSENKVLTLEEVEKNSIELALKKCKGNVLEAARRLKIGQATLYRKIRKFSLRSKEG